MFLLWISKNINVRKDVMDEARIGGWRKTKLRYAIWLIQHAFNLVQISFCLTQI